MTSDSHTVLTDHDEEAVPHHFGHWDREPPDPACTPPCSIREMVRLIARQTTAQRKHSHGESHLNAGLNAGSRKCVKFESPVLSRMSLSSAANPIR